jgi:hypothetical protein
VLDLSQLDFEDLKGVLRDRLHGLDAGGPPIDPHGNEPVYQWILDTYGRADRRVQDRLLLALKDLLGELPDEQAWPRPAAQELLGLLQRCGRELAPSIRDLARSGQLIQSRPNDGRDIQALLLKPLIAAGDPATVTFWKEQLNLLGPTYGALIVSAMLPHGLDRTLRELLPDVTADERASQWLVLLLPTLHERCGGMEAVREAFRSHLAGATEPGRSILARALRIQPGTSLPLWLSGERAKNEFSANQNPQF